MRDDAGAARVLSALEALRADVAGEGRARYRSFRPLIARPDFAACALNLAHYLALRRRDHRSLQRELMLRGLSSLGRLEGRVLATLDAVAVALAGLSGCETAARAPSRRAFFRGEARLRAA